MHAVEICSFVMPLLLSIKRNFLLIQPTIYSSTSRGSGTHGKFREVSWVSYIFNILIKSNRGIAGFH